MLTEVFFDVETQKLFSDIEGNNPEKLGVSIVSIYEREIDQDHSEIKGTMKSFWEDEIENIWKIFQEADRIIGFNSLGFDIPVLSPYTNFPLSKLNNFDILDEFKKVAGRRVSLNTLARDNLGIQKTDIGINAVYYWQQKDEESLKKLKKYCEDDVEITRKIYDYALIHKKLNFKDKWNTLRTVDIDFSYPEDSTSTDEQIGLF